MENKKIKFPIAAIFFAITTLFSFIGIRSYLNIYDIWYLIANILLCYVLFTKRANIMLLIPLGVRLLYSIIGLLNLFRMKEMYTTYNIDIYTPLLQTIFDILTWLSVLAIALICFDFNFIKKDLKNLRPITTKLFFVPAIFSIFSIILIIIKGLSIVNSINLIIGTIAVFLFCLWMVDPYVNEKKAIENTGNQSSTTYSDNAYCSIGKHILLLLFTFGIWPLIWIYRITNYLNKAPNAPIYTPTNQLLLCIFVPFYQIYWLYKHGQKIDNLAKSQNINTSDMATTCLILGIFIPVVAYIIMQDRINTICLNKAK